MVSIAWFINDDIPMIAWLTMIGTIPPIVGIKAIGDSVELEFRETMKNLNVFNHV